MSLSIRAAGAPNICWLRGALVMIVLAAPATLAEIAAGPEVPTTAQFREKELAFNLRSSAQAYQAKANKHNPAWDAAAVAFLEGCERKLGANAGPAALAELERQGRDLYVRAGCDDAMVEYMYGRLLNAMGQAPGAERLSRRAAERLALQGYSAERRAFAAMRAYMLMTARHRKEARNYAELLINAIVDMMADPAFAGNRDILCNHLEALIDPLRAADRQKAWQAAKKVSGADRVALLMMEGAYHIEAAWKDRGGGYARSATEKGWQGFGTHLDEARRCLTAAWEADHSVPEPAAMMITVAMGSGGEEEMRTWFDRAVAARLDDEDVFHAYMYGLYPRWHGSREKLVDFANECLATRRFDTHVPIFFLDTLLVVRQECDAGDMSAWREPELYDKIEEVLQKSIAPGGDLADDDHYRAIQAAFAVRGQRWEDARRTLEAIRGELDPSGTGHMGLAPWEVRGQTRAHIGPASDDVYRGQQLVADGKRREAIEAYEAAEKKEQDADTLRYLANVVQALRWEADFYEDKPVDLAADKGLTGFRPAFGQWGVDSDGALIGKVRTGEEQLYVACAADFGDRWDLEADVDFLHTQEAWTSTGIALAPEGSTAYLGLVLNRKTQKLSEFVEFNVERSTESAPVRTHNKMIVRRQGDRCTVSVNGKEVYQGALADGDGNHLRLGFGGFPAFEGDSVRFAHVRVRRIE